MTLRIDDSSPIAKRQKLPDQNAPVEDLSHLIPEPAEASGAPIGEVEPLTDSGANDLTTLFQDTLLVEDGADLVIDLNQYDPRTFTIRILQDNGMLTEENRAMVMDHKDPQSLCSAVADLFAMEIFDHQLLSILSKRSNPNFITQTLLQFQQVRGLTEETFEFVLKHPDPQLLYSFIDILRGLERFTTEAFHQCAAHPMAASLAAYLSLLIETNLPVEKYYDMAFKEINLTYLVQVIKIFKNAGILTDENIALALTLENPRSSDDILHILEKLITNNLLNEANYRAAVQSRDFRSISSIASALYWFEYEQLLDQTTYNLIVDPSKKWSAVLVAQTLSEGGLLNEAHLEAAASHKKSKEFAEAIVFLNQHNLLTSELYKLTVGHEFPNEFARAVVQLHQSEILTDENRDLLAQHTFPEALAEGIICLSEGHCLTEENLQRVFHHKYPKDCALFLKALSSSRNKAKDQFLRDDFELIMESSAPLSIIYAWDVLNHAGILTEENKKRVLSCEPERYGSMALGLHSLHRSNLWNDENIDYIKNSYHPNAAAEVLIILRDTNLLNEENRKRICYLHFGQGEAIRFLHDKKLFDQIALEWLSSEKIPERCRVARGCYFMDAEIFSVLRSHDQPEKLVDALSALKDKNIPVKEHLQLLAAHPSPNGLANGFGKLKDSDLPQECYASLAQVKEQPFAVASIYCKLHEANQLSEQNRKIAANCKNYNLVEGVDVLLAEDLFNEVNFDAAVNHRHPTPYCNALKIMKQNGVPIEEFRILITKHEFPDNLAIILCSLHKKNLLTPERAQQAAEHSNPEDLSDLIYELKWAELLSAETWAEGILHPNVYAYSEILNTMKFKEILTEETRSLVAKHPNTQKLEKAVNDLGKRDKLTLDNFLLIVERPDPFDAIALLS